MPPDLILQDFPKRLSLLFFLPAPCPFHFFRFNSLLTFFGKILNVFTLLWMIRKILMKKNFIEISDSNLKFFRDLWRILIPCGLFSCAYYWLKYNFRSFPQSLDDAKHVRIHSMNIKIFFEKKVFIEISDPNLIFETESIWGNLTTCQLWVSKKNFWDIF